MTARYEEVRLADIVVPNNRRPISSATVNALMSSILEIGLQNPIGLTTDYRLIHGAHRLAAYRELQWDAIPAIIHDLDELHAELAEIDENIQRKQLTKAEECKALARRKQIYESLHPETKRGGDKTAKSKKQNDKMSFSSDTAAKTGKSKRSVERDAALGLALSDDVLEKIAATPVANNKSELKKLAKLDADMQQTVANMLAEGECSSVTEALRSDDEVEPEPAEPDRPKLHVPDAGKPKELHVSKSKSSEPDHRFSETYAHNTARVAITQLQSIPRRSKFRSGAFNEVAKWVASAQEELPAVPTAVDRIEDLARIINHQHFMQCSLTALNAFLETIQHAIAKRSDV